MDLGLANCDLGRSGALEAHLDSAKSDEFNENKALGPKKFACGAQLGGSRRPPQTPHNTWVQA